ncbi:MAG: DsbE family thiol:disulfide interchange protein [Gammaproteobacteria bacterium]|nr:DsbE family thiol:disulfide interchange protein [Gammaproteobacteria bacterium]MBV9622139.1 DsbE family thiol:disulfide interchange protein [Gammaproteobacteria bacterium]
MNRFALPLGLFLLLAVVLFVGIRHSPDKGIIVSPLLNKPAPEFALPALDAPERIVRPQDLRGRWYLLNVWGTWCVACREEHEMLLRVRAAGVVPLVGIDWKDDDQQAQAWLRQLGNPYEVVAVDHSGRTAIDWGVYAAPETFLVSPQGIVVYKCTGELTEEIWNKEILPRVRPAAVTSG